MVENNEGKKPEPEDKSETKSIERSKKNFWSIVNEALHLHNMLAPPIYLIVLYAIIHILESLGAKSEFFSPSFKVGLLIAILGFLIALVTFLDSNKRLKNLEEKILNLKIDESTSKLEKITTGSGAYSKISVKNSDFTNNKKYKERIILGCTVFSLALVMLLAYLASISFVEVAPTITYHLTPLIHNYNLTRIESISTSGEIKEIITEKKTFIVKVDLITTALITNNPITVSADFDFGNMPENSWESLDDFMLLVFPNAYNTGEFDGGETKGGIIKLNKMPKDPKRGYDLYRGYGEITFPLEGDFGYVILTPEMASDVKKVSHGDGTVTLHITTLNLDEKTEPKSRFHVDNDPPDESLKIQTLGVSLAYVGIAIGVVQLRSELIKGITWIVTKKFQNL